MRTAASACSRVGPDGAYAPPPPFPGSALVLPKSKKDVCILCRMSCSVSVILGARTRCTSKCLTPGPAEPQCSAVDAARSCAPRMLAADPPADRRRRRCGAAGELERLRNERRGLVSDGTSQQDRAETLQSHLTRLAQTLQVRGRDCCSAKRDSRVRQSAAICQHLHTALWTVAGTTPRAACGCLHAHVPSNGSAQCTR